MRRFYPQQTSLGVSLFVVFLGFFMNELMIVIAIIGILDAIAIPAYKTYTIRAQVSEGLGFADAAKVAVSESFIASGKWPVDNAAAGLDTSTNITSKYVKSVTNANGQITVLLGGDLDPAASAGGATPSVVFTPAV